jgi:deoxyribodipyrimidine photo-lyase
MPLIDALMREMNETGFMPNRGRMVVACYLTMDLKQDWR